MTSTARRMFELVEPIGAVPYADDAPTEAMYCWRKPNRSISRRGEPGSANRSH